MSFSVIGSFSGNPYDKDRSAGTHISMYAKRHHAVSTGGTQSRRASIRNEGILVRNGQMGFPFVYRINFFGEEME